MSDPTKATTYSVFEDRGDGKLYLVQTFPTLIEAQRMSRFHVMRAANEGTVLHELVIIRNEMSEVERVDRAAAEEFQRAQEAAEAPNVEGFPLGKPKLIL